MVQSTKRKFRLVQAVSRPFLQQLNLLEDELAHHRILQYFEACIILIVLPNLAVCLDVQLIAVRDLQSQVPFTPHAHIACPLR